MEPLHASIDNKGHSTQGMPHRTLHAFRAIDAGLELVEVRPKGAVDYKSLSPLRSVKKRHGLRVWLRGGMPREVVVRNLLIHVPSVSAGESAPTVPNDLGIVHLDPIDLITTLTVPFVTVKSSTRPLPYQDRVAAPNAGVWL